MMNMKTFK